MPDPKESRKYIRRERAQGDFLIYTILHNLISVILFFSFAGALGLFDRRTETITEIFIGDFFGLVGTVFLLSFIVGIVSRGLAYYIMYCIIVVWRKRQMKSIGILNRGINRLSLAWAISLLIGSLLFSIGALIILQILLFGEESFIALIIAYLIMKGFVFILVRTFANFKL